MKVGYARVSTPAQTESLEAQSKTLEGHGCERVYNDIASGAKASRPGLNAALDYLRPGDVLVVTRLDRLGRSAADTLATLKELGEREINVLALDVNLDSSTAGGQNVP